LSLLQTQALVGSKYESGSLMEVCSPTSESLGCDSIANGPSVLPCHVCCSRVGSGHGSVKRDRVKCPHAWSVRSYGELAVAFVPTGTCVTWQGFSRVIRCYAYGDRCSMACLDGSGLASLEAWVGFVQRLCCTFMVRRRTACRGLHHGVYTYSQQPIETPPTASPYGGRALHGHERAGEGHGGHGQATRRIALSCTGSRPNMSPLTCPKVTGTRGCQKCVIAAKARAGRRSAGSVINNIAGWVVAIDFAR
jgi:hypothetical protein